MANPTDIRETGVDGLTKTFPQPAPQTGDTFWSGLIVQYAGAVAPPEWLLCNGDAVSRWTFAALFAAIGTSYGAGDGSTTFNLPDLRDKLTVGVSGTRPLASSGGAATVALAIGELAVHAHTAPSSGAASVGSTGTISANHGHSFTQSSGNVTVSLGIEDQVVCGPISGGNMNNNSPTHSHSMQSHTHTITVNNNGSGSAHNNMMPYVALNHIIRI